MKRVWRQFLRYAGCVDGTSTFMGPRRAEIYLTNKCNLDCIACWTFSPLLKGTNALLPVEIDWPAARQLIEDLAEGGCEEVLFVGGGEPMIYPKIMEALELVKSRGMACYVTTNMTPVTSKRARKMMEIGIDRIYASLWAANRKTYAATHPNASEKDFDQIDERLRELNQLKLTSGREVPRVIIHNVIFNTNCHEVGEMVDYALEVGADAVQFTVAYTLPDRTDVLLMNEEEIQDVLRQLDGIQSEVKAKEGLHGEGTFLWEIDLFRSRLREEKAPKGDYDGSLLDGLPCQIGWFYTIIRADGSVIPCCKGCNRPMGNVNDRPFREIWVSPLYDDFRDKAKRLPKTDPYFEPIGCLKMCDNLGQIRTIEDRMEKVRPLEPATRLALPLIRRFFG
jgi:MoaA/NifB/PqqE/SkfB family radical SAM enzyme